MADHSESIAFVIGDPIAQSKSPLIHTHWLKLLQLQGRYDARHIVPEDLQGFLEQVLTDETVPGGNVTAPHKESVCRWLKANPQKTRLTKIANRLGAVNTLYRDGGLLVGDNTDGYGFTANLDDRSPGWDKDLSQILIIGAGGASRAIALALDERREAGSEIHIVNRTLSRAESIIEELQLSDASAHTLQGLNDLAAKATFVVNTTSLGMSGHDGSKLLNDAASKLRPTTIATDIVYTPLMTEFLQAAADSGAATVDGLGMLLHQAVPGFEAWFGVRPKVTADLRQLVLTAMDAG